MGCCDSTTDIPSSRLLSMAPMPNGTVTPHDASPDALRTLAVSSSEHNLAIKAPSPSSNGSKQRARETDPPACNGCSGETIASRPSQVSPLFAADTPLPLQNHNIAPATKATHYMVLAPSPSHDYEIPVSNALRKRMFLLQTNLILK